MNKLLIVIALALNTITYGQRGDVPLTDLNRIRLERIKKAKEKTQNKYNNAVNFSISSFITLVPYDDGSSSLTVTYKDGSTQNYFEAPDGAISNGTAGTDSHSDFVSEAKQAKEVNGVKSIDTDIIELDLNN